MARSYRSDPANACTDAEIQITTMVLIVLLTVFLIGGSIAFPVYLRKFLNGGDSMYGVLIALTIGIAYGTHKRFGGYEFTPELARDYATAKSHRWSIIVYWSVMIGFLVIAWTMLGHRRH
jgi:hypothetical protein